MGTLYQMCINNVPVMQKNFLIMWIEIELLFSGPKVYQKRHTNRQTLQSWLHHVSHWPHPTSPLLAAQQQIDNSQLVRIQWNF